MVTALTVSPRLQKIYAWSFIGLASGWNFATIKCLACRQ